MIEDLYSYHPARRRMQLTFNIQPALLELERLARSAAMGYATWCGRGDEAGVAYVPPALWAGHYVRNWLSAILDLPPPASVWVPRHRRNLSSQVFLYGLGGGWSIQRMIEAHRTAQIQAHVGAHLDFLHAIHDVLRRDLPGYPPPFELNEDLFVPVSPIGKNILTGVEVGPVVMDGHYPDWRRVSMMQAPPSARWRKRSMRQRTRD